MNTPERWKSFLQLPLSAKHLELRYWWRALWGGGKGSYLLIDYMPRGFTLSLALGLLALAVAWTTAGWESWIWATVSVFNALLSALDVVIAVGRRDAAQQKAVREYWEREAIRRSNERWPGSVDGYLDKIADEQASIRKHWQ